MVSFFTRKAYAEMLDWKSRLADRYALMVEGARRTGKTSLLKKFVEREYESSIFIDFSLTNKTVSASKRAFSEAEDIEDLISRLELIFATKLVPGKSCIVFDEVQLFPIARGTIKSLVEYGRFHYIESGSLVGIKENVKDILIPSEEHKMKIFPLDFEEFLDALREQPIKEHIRECFDARKPLARDIHEKAMNLFRLYMLVGGMPQSVAAYVGNPGERLEASDAAKREILSLYEDDIGKYAKGYAVKVRDIFRAIPGALARHEKKFHLSEIGANARRRRYETAFLWLSDAMVANMAYNATSPDTGLSMSLDHESFKCYLLDTGLLLTQSLSGERTTDARLIRGVLHDNLGINEGMFAENVVAQTLAASGHPLYFYSRRDRSREDGTLEIDFIVKNGIKTCPIEVKSANYKSHISLDRYSARYMKHLGARYVLCRGEYAFENGVTYLPLYMAHLI